MKLVKVAAGVLNQTPIDWSSNLKNISDTITLAREEGCSLLCLPELCITGYGCEDAFHSAGIRDSAVQALIVDGALIGFVTKQHLAGDGIHYEPRWFKAWPAGIQAEVEIDDVEYPVGDLIFDVGGIRIGFEICEDAWVVTRPGGSLAARGADIILNPSASHFAFEKHDVRKRFVLEGSRAFRIGPSDL